MLTDNPFSQMLGLVSPFAIQAYVVLMILLVAGGTILDTLHKKSAKYFFNNAEKARTRASRRVGMGEKVSIAIQTVAVDVLTSGEFCNQRRRLAHLLTMYGFIIFVVTTAIMIFGYLQTDTPAILPLLWHLGALMVCYGGYWFWFFIRVDVAAEGNPWYRVIPADLFVLSLLATTTFALIWSFFEAVGVRALSNFFFVLFIAASTLLFGSVLWSKFAHMFFKPAAAFQKRVAKADGSRDGLPPPADKPEQYGLGIKRLQPRNY